MGSATPDRNCHDSQPVFATIAGYDFHRKKLSLRLAWYVHTNNMSMPESSLENHPLHVRRFDLSLLEWKVAGYSPMAWTGASMELGFAFEPEIAPVPARVPGSVQGALRRAGLLPDWFEGVASRDCEWVENREWMFTAKLPDDWFAGGSRCVLHCGGLDGPGVVVFNKRQVAKFDNAFVPYSIDLTGHVQPSGNELHLIFLNAPRWLGPSGYTSQFKDWKPRFNYTWDWIPRLVQIGPWEPVTLEVSQAASLDAFRCRTGWDLAKKTGEAWFAGTIHGAAGSRARLSLFDGGMLLKSGDVSAAALAGGITWNGLKVEPWWPNGSGDRKLYRVTCEALDESGGVLDSAERSVGFKNVAWQPCAGAPEAADPWICVINGTPVFLQGINWTPIRAMFADLTPEDYRKLVTLYAEMGCNIFRVWGGATLEKTVFYNMCDELGILVWQEFPLTSSGHENWPHEDEPSIRTLESIAASYIARRQHHASLLLWCGGNELQGAEDGGKVGVGKPVGMDHPLMRRWAALVDREDPGRRFLPTSASGPHFMADEKRFGQGVHWDVHGPWTLPGGTLEHNAVYWGNDDALFRSETGAPGASSAEIIRRYSGGLPVMPGTAANPLWRRFSWWIEWAAFIKEKGGEPASLEDYVAWSQARQAEALAQATRCAKKRFPGIGGMIFWMGHDSFPCTANTSIVDFHGDPKPAALAIAKIWKTSVGELQRS